MNTLLSILNPGGIVLGLFLSLILFRQRKEQGRGRSMLAFLLLFCALNALAVEILLRSGLVAAGRMLPFFGPVLLLLGPLLYMYVLMVTGDFRHTAADIPHFVPAAAHVILLAAGVVIRHFFFGFLALHLVIYLILVLRRVILYRRLLRDTVSSPERADPAWLLWFGGVLVVFYAGLFLMFFLQLHTARGDLVPALFSFLLTLTIALLGYRSLTQKALPPGTVPAPLPNADKGAPRTPATELAPLHETLVLYMERVKPYRDPDLTLPALAEETGINRNILSRIINEREGMNFSDYINSARLAHARAALADPARREQTILQIAFDAGFNSKTTFNTFFRRKEGVTPTAFREKNLAGRSGL